MMSTVRMQLEILVSSLTRLHFSHLHIRQIARIRRFLCDESVKTLVHAFVNCRLDICHYYTLANLIQKLQRVQNCAARLIMKERTFDHVTQSTTRTSLASG